MTDKELIAALRLELLRCADALDGAALVLGHDKQIVTAATCRERAFDARIAAGMGKDGAEGQTASGGQETGQGVAAVNHVALTLYPVDPTDYNGYNPLQAEYAAKVAVRRRAEELAFIAKKESGFAVKS